jgi:beta-glucuronidase
MLYPRDTISRQNQKLDGMWRFAVDPKESGRKEGWIHGLKEYTMVPVPSSFQDLFTDKFMREYTGDVWYETEFFVPEDWKGSVLEVRFGSVTHRAEVYLNGIRVAEHEGGFTPFCANITAEAFYGSYNKLVVIANNELNEINIPCGRTITLDDGRKMAKPYFDFYNYSGIQRSVWVVRKPQISIRDYDLSYEITGEDAAVSYEIYTSQDLEDCKVSLSIVDEEGNVAAYAVGEKGRVTVEKVHLWQVRNSYLYKFIFRICRGETVVDEYIDFIGIRTVEILGTDIRINGQPVYLKGFGKHEDSDIRGRGLDLVVIKRDFELMKWIGANSFRTAHYPYSEEVYQMADREGFLVTDEVAAVGMFESLMNFMEASKGEVTSFFSKKTTPALLETHKKALEELIVRDKNHACVIAWSLFNEPETSQEEAVGYFKEIFELAHELDVQKRPRTFSLIMNSTPDVCKCYPFCDFISLNRYYGWYVKGGYEIDDAEKAFRRELDAWEKLSTGKPFVFTEYGADTSAFVHKLPSVMWSQEYQIEYLTMCHRVFDSYAFVKGEQVWNFADFQTTEGIMRMDGNKKGIFTRQRQPKDAAYYFKARWDSLPLDYKSSK